MARRRGFGALPLIGVLTAPKLIALGVGAWAMLRSRTPSGSIDVEAKPQSSMLPSSAPSVAPVYSDSYAASVADPYVDPAYDPYAAADPYYDTPASDYVPPNPFTAPGPVPPPPPPSTDSGFLYTSSRTLAPTKPTSTYTASAPTTQTRTSFFTTYSTREGSAGSGGSGSTVIGSKGGSEDIGRSLKGLRRPRN